MRLLVTAGLLGACAGEAALNESGESGLDSGMTTNPECPTEGGSGLPVGEAQCSDGKCDVPAGEFWMGSSEGLTNECPPRVVTLPAYTIAEFETTREEYQECVDAGSCTPTPVPCGHLDEELDPNRVPVTCVDFTQARTYCEWRGGRLPSEAEWERAARGDEGARWGWGDAAPECDDANFRFVSWYCHKSVVEVGSYDRPSPYGLKDTTGNAWEWVEDFYDAGYYSEAPDDDPRGPDECSLEVGGERGECLYRVMRGGAFNTTEETTRGSSRSFALESVTDENLGFRCAW